MALSLQKGERVILARVDAFADGVAVKQVRGTGGMWLLAGDCSLHEEPVYRCRRSSPA